MCSHSPSGKKKAAERPMSRVIAKLLAAGVGASALIVATGLLLLIATGKTGYEGTVRLPSVGGAGASYPRAFAEVFAGVLALKPIAVIELGLIALIATPVFRVVASIPLFLMERDRLYVLITAAVLTVLLVSIFWIH